MTESTASRAAPARARPRRADKAGPYHHGSLPKALLQAAETVLKRGGLRGLTLRAIAREAGVSHTAPQHHFGDTAGVLSELAAAGHRRLANEMEEQARSAAPGKPRRKATAHGYIDFAIGHPDLFRLMSRNELLDSERPSLVEARQISARALAGVFDAATKPQQEAGPFAGIGTAQAIAITAAWAYVHGLATVLVDHRLDSVARAAPDFGDARALVEAAIDSMKMVPDA
ncbi:TetR/AcrR family transcriptional regulator [Caballeronia sp. dw_19]|uniref:TetR/AcrR family transcriptional regulator n=1 Tax=Caballeronia sp. dw_19 TaxID=2719791 RepID=UPI001BD5B00B|nr:TetR/AcrR family transcriptional regulator [Caballeronia sp. dw_19]